MNICILYGKIVSEIYFKFIINSKRKSKVEFEIKLRNKSIVKVITYDEMADYAYYKLKKEDTVVIEGKLTNDGEVFANTIKIY